MDEEMMEKLFPVFKALLDEDRLRILGILANGDLPVGNLAALIKLKPAALQRHLALLTENGLVQTAQAETLTLDVRHLHEIKRYLFAITADPTADLSPEEKVLAAFVEGDRLKEIPTKTLKLIIVLEWLADKFELDRRYPEREVNEIIQHHHPDFATLRRYLVDFGMMHREKGIYWRLNDNAGN
jgi:hypothetical protein